MSVTSSLADQVGRYFFRHDNLRQVDQSNRERRRSVVQRIMNGVGYCAASLRAAAEMD